jgi:mannose-1-phosphate guanylyltransferase
VRKASEFFGASPFLVMAADALTDVDLGALRAAHESNGGIATLTVKQVADTSEFGVVVTGSDGRVQGFQEKPDPAEALSNLASCMIYMLEPEIFDYFPDEPEVDFALDVFPALLENDVPFHVHETSAYWNDVGSPGEFRQGNFDALAGEVEIDHGAEPAGDGILCAPGAVLPDGAEIEAPVLIGAGAEIDADVVLEGPVVIGDGCRIGRGARLKRTVLLPDTEVLWGTILVEAIGARRG